MITALDEPIETIQHNRHSLSAGVSAACIGTLATIAATCIYLNRMPLCMAVYGWRCLNVGWLWS